MKTKTKQRIWFIVLISMLALFFLTGCKTKHTFTNTHSIEYRDRFVRDSIYNRDTLRVYQKGDTIFNEVIKWRERFLTDTVTVIKTDSIDVVVEKIVEVNKLTWWQNLQINATRVLLVIILILGFILFIKR